MNAASRWILVSAGALGFTGVLLGAFGAHYLKETLAIREMTSAWQTAVLYQLVHSVALLGLGLAGGGLPNVRVIGGGWSLGVIFFSGSLYWLALGGPKLLGPITPLGGLAFLAGWAGVIWAGCRPVKP